MTRESITFSTRRFLVGKAGPFPRLVFREEAMLSLDQFAHLKAKGEHGGFLIGKKRELRSAERYEVLVERFVPIPQRDDAARLVINQEHVLTVQKALDSANRGEEIVGWAHTHPGFGVFLSHFDKEQHQRYFPRPWQIAYVMDNLAHERAAYFVAGDEWQRLGGYYVLREMAENELTLEAEDSIRWSRLGLVALLIILLAGAISYGYTLLRPIISPEPVVNVVQSPPETTPEPVVSVQRKELTVTSEPLENVSGTELPIIELPFHSEYVVQKGDNLWKIAQKLWGDPNLFTLLVEENNIRDPSVIRVGRVLRVPPHVVE